MPEDGSDRAFVTRDLAPGGGRGTLRLCQLGYPRPQSDAFLVMTKHVLSRRFRLAAFDEGQDLEDDWGDPGDDADEDEDTGYPPPGDDEAD